MEQGNQERQLDRLRERRHWFLDLDGTTYLGERLLPGTADLLAWLRSRRVGYTFLTNNSSRDAGSYVRKLRDLGLPIPADAVMTSGAATAAHLAETRPDARVFLLGTDAFAAECEAHGVQLHDRKPDTVVLGFDPHLSYERLTKAVRLLRGDMRYLASHPDVLCPSADGPIPDAGAVIELIAACTGRRPQRIIGKPAVTFLQYAASRAGIDPATAVMVGDRVETDIEMARAFGIPSVLVLTGVTSEADPRAHEGSDTLVTPDLATLLEKLRAASRDPE